MFAATVRYGLPWLTMDDYGDLIGRPDSTLHRVKFAELSAADLVVGTVYEGGRAGHIGDEPISKLVPGAGNQGGIRSAGPADARRLVVLFTTWRDHDWPDALDTRTGRFTYYGDNKTPGKPLHESGLGGNLTFKIAFDHLHAVAGGRRAIPPFLAFAHRPTNTSSRAVQFLGLCAPGFPAMPESEDLVALWKTANCERFQNYRATFTVLDVPVVPRSWLRDLAAGTALTDRTPSAWLEFVEWGTYRPIAR